MEEWCGEGGTVGKIARALRLNANQYRCILNIIVQTHHATDWRRVRINAQFCAGSVAIQPGIPQEQAIADYCKHGFKYTKTTLLINRQCLQGGRPVVTHSAVCTCELLNQGQRHVTAVLCICSCDLAPSWISTSSCWQTALSQRALTARS